MKYILLFFSSMLFSQLPINHAVTMEICDSNNDNMETINLSDANSLISTNSSYLFSYFSTLSNAQNNINSLPSIQVINGSKTFYARVVEQGGNIDYASIFFDLKNCTMNVSPTTNKQKSLVFPNPATDFINVTSEKNSNLKEIFSFDGKKLKSSYENKISVAELKSGIYFLKIIKENGVETIKFIKK